MTANDISVAVINYTFPVTTQTFHHRRHRAMLQAGVLNAIHFVKRGDGSLEGSASAIARSAMPVRVAHLIRSVTVLRDNNVRRALAGGVVRARNNNGEGGRLGFLWQALHGMAIGQVAVDNGATHIHAVFATAPMSIGLFASLVSGCPLSVEVHTPTTRFVNSELLKWKLRHADLVVSISDYTTDWLRDLDSDLHPVVVRCGLDVSPPADREATTIDVLSVGSLAPKKGHDVLIDAVAQLPGVGLAIVGAGPDHRRLAAQARALDLTVDFQGALSPDDVAERRRRARVGTLASVRTEDGDEDGIPVALMEFMLDGVPIVASDIAGIRELLADGEAGELVPPGDSDALAEALKRALSDADWRSRVSRSARQRIESTFNNEVETARLLDHLRGLRRQRP